MALEHHDRILIVADGPSAAPLRHLTIPDGVYVIAVNGAVRWVSRCDAFFTLDPSLRNMKLMQDKRRGVRYFAAVPADFGLRSARVRHFRYRPPDGVTYLQRISGSGPHAAEPGMCRYEHGVHSGNSAWGALGLAHKLGPSRIGLAGVDGTREVRTSGGRPNDLDHLPWLFSTYNGPAEIMNGSPDSAVDCFPRCDLPELLRWLK